MNRPLVLVRIFRCHFLVDTGATKTFVKYDVCAEARRLWKVYDMRSFCAPVLFVPMKRGKVARRRMKRRTGSVHIHVQGTLLCLLPPKLVCGRLAAVPANIANPTHHPLVVPRSTQQGITPHGRVQHHDTEGLRCRLGDGMAPLQSPVRRIANDRRNVRRHCWEFAMRCGDVEVESTSAVQLPARRAH